MVSFYTMSPKGMWNFTHAQRIMLWMREYKTKRTPNISFHFWGKEEIKQWSGFMWGDLKLALMSSWFALNTLSPIPPRPTQTDSSHPYLCEIGDGESKWREWKSVANRMGPQMAQWEGRHNQLLTLLLLAVNIGFILGYGI